MAAGTAWTRVCPRALVSLLVLVVLVGASTRDAAVAASPTGDKFALSAMSPAGGSTVAGTVVWQVGYTGAAPERVEFYVDGVLRWTEYAEPFRFAGDQGSLDTSSLSPGRHLLRAVGYRGKRRRQVKIKVTVSSAGSPAAAPVPTMVSSPSISGATSLGSRLTAQTGTWSGSPTSYGYQWQRCDGDGANCAPIVDANAPSYVLDAADVDQTVRVSVTATNGSGPSAPANSAVTGVVHADLAVGRPSSASSIESGSYTPDEANDGNSTTRWSSAFTDNQWWQVDLGALEQVDTVALNWETAYASTYEIQTSTDGTTFTDAATVSIGSSGWQTTTFPAVSARYVRILGVTRATPEGISFWEAEVFGSGNPDAGRAPVSTSPPTVSGPATAGETLTASTGSWTGTTPMSYAYTWVRCASAADLSSCSGITGAAASSYTAVLADVGAYLRVSVAASNSAGWATVVSDPTVQVGAAPAPTPAAVFNPRAAWLETPWNADAASASVDPNSGALISTWVARGNIRFPNICTNSWSAAWTTGGSTDPKYDVTQTKYPGPLDGQIPIPRGTLPSADADHHLVVLDLARNRVSEFWQAAYNSTTDSWSAGSGVSFDIGGRPPVGSGSNAAGFPQLALAIWPEEIQEGVINHALAFSTLQAAPSYRYPAGHSDGQGDMSDLPEGTWLALPASLTPNPFWPAWVKVVFRALQQHGMFLMDQGGTLGIAGVNPINGGVKWSEVGMGTGGSAGFPSDFPWSSMRVLSPPAA